MRACNDVARTAGRLYRWKVIPVPLPMIPLETEPNRRTYVISREEEALLGAALADSNTCVWPFITLGLATGLRRTEMLAARFSAFDPRYEKGVMKKGSFYFICRAIVRDARILLNLRENHELK